MYPYHSCNKPLVYFNGIHTKENVYVVLLSSVIAICSFLMSDFRAAANENPQKATVLNSNRIK